MLHAMRAVFILFCAGVGVQHPDVTNSSRAIKSSEVDMCKSNGVEEIIEVELTKEERAALEKSAEHVRGTIAKLKELM